MMTDAESEYYDTLLRERRHDDLIAFLESDLDGRIADPNSSDTIRMLLSTYVLYGAILRSKQTAATGPNPWHDKLLKVGAKRLELFPQELEVRNLIVNLFVQTLKEPLAALPFILPLERSIAFHLAEGNTLHDVYWHSVLRFLAFAQLQDARWLAAAEALLVPDFWQFTAPIRWFGDGIGCIEDADPATLRRLVDMLAQFPRRDEAALRELREWLFGGDG